MFRKKKENKEEEQTKNLKKTKKTKKEIREKRNSQNAIHYNMMIKNGICVLPNKLYSATMQLNDINYQIALEEEKEDIFSNYASILNALGQENGLQLTIHNRKIDEEEFEKEVFKEMKFDDNDKFRKEYNQMFKEKISTGNNKIVSDKMITFTVKEDNYADAKKSIQLLQKEFTNRFKDINCELQTVNGYKRLETINSILNPDKKFFFNYDLLDKSYTTKDAVAPDLLDFKSEGTGAFKINDRFAKVFYLKNWSNELNDKLISSLTSLEHNLTISLHMRMIPRADAIGLVKNQIAKMEGQKMVEEQKAIKRNYDPSMIPMNLKDSYTEAKILREKVEKHDLNLFECQFLIMLNSKTKDELKIAEKAIETTCKKLNTELGVLYMRQEEGMNAVLPLGTCVKGLARTLDTSVCAILMPFTSQELMQKGQSIYYGLNAITNNMIMANRKTLDAASGWIFGKTGSGKSFAVKNEMTQIMFDTNDEVVVVDPQGEFIPLAKEFGGSCINVDTKSGVHFNAFSGNIHERNFIKEKGEFALMMMAEIIGEGKLSPSQKGLIDKCVRKMYADYSMKLKDTSNPIRVEMPCLDDLYRQLKMHDSAEAREMSMALELYITGGTNDLFSGQNNVDLRNRFTVYNIFELPESLRPLAMKVILETLKSKVISNAQKGIRTWIYIDEYYLLLKDEYSENFLYEFFKWVRKFLGIITGITQNVEEILNSQKTRAMLANAEFMMLLNQATSDLDELEHLLKLSPEQASYISNSRRGSGLIVFGKTIIPFINEFPEDTELYKLWDTDPNKKEFSINDFYS